MRANFNWVLLALGAGALLAARKASSSSKTSVTPTASALPSGQPVTPDQSVPLEEYIRQLWLLGDELLPSLKGWWSESRLKAMTLAASKAYAVDPSIAWAYVFGESSGTPVSTYGYWNGPEPAIAKCSTAYGVTQMLSNRFAGEQKQHPERHPWQHADLIFPDVAIWTTAASIKRAYEKYGGRPSNDRMAKWWAGDPDKTDDPDLKAILTKGVARKTKHLNLYGKQVHDGAAHPSELDPVMLMGPDAYQGDSAVV